MREWVRVIRSECERVNEECMRVNEVEENDRVKERVSKKVRVSGYVSKRVRG